MPVPLLTSANQASQRFTRLYVASLSAIAMLSIAGQIFVQQQLARQTHDIAIITAAQKRQTLCERLLKATLAVRLSPPGDRAESVKQLEALLTEWEATRTAIRQEMQTMVSAQELTEVDPIFDRLKPLATEIVAMANQSVAMDAAPGDRLRDRLAQRTAGEPPQMPVARLIQAGTEFNQTIDKILVWYTAKAQNGISHLRMLEFGLLGLTIGTLLLEGFLVFRPAIGKLKQTLQALEASLANLAIEQEKSEKLLLNILPSPIADRLKRKSEAIADSFSEATVLFADIVGFTELSSRLTPQELVQCLNQIFSCFDNLAEKYGLEKIKTIGDAYMVVGGLPNPRSDHAAAIASMAIDMQKELQAINRSMGEKFDIRIGINSGPVVAGVIGIKKFIYDLWGDTVNIASRMESHGESGAIHISEATYRLIEGQFNCELRGAIAVKGKGQMTTYWLRTEAQASRSLASSVI
jgi:adenylate cyclase